MPNNQTNGVPGFPGTPSDIYSYRNEFDYSLWTKDSTLFLCNVPWDAAYKDIVRFDSEQQRDDYFDGLIPHGHTLSVSTRTIIQYGLPVVINVPFNTANNYNYIVVTSAPFPVPNESPTARTQYYYFITSMQYLSPNATQVQIQLDVVMTYLLDCTITRGYLNRGHYSFLDAESEQWPPYHNCLIVPEEFERGSEMRIMSTRFYAMQGVELWVIFAITCKLDGNYGTKDNPVFTTSTGSYVTNIPSSSSVYAVKASNYIKLFSALSDYPWVTQCVQNVTAVPSDIIDDELESYITIGGVSVYSFKNPNPPTKRIDIEVPATDINDPRYNWFEVPQPYGRLKKFGVWPYATIEMTDNAGQSVLLRPENIHAVDSTIGFAFKVYKFQLYTCAAPGFMREVIVPIQYNTDQEATTPMNVYMMGSSSPTTVPFDGGEFTHSALTLSNFPNFSIVNNSYLLNYAMTAHTRTYAYDNAQWDLNKTLRSNQVGWQNTNQTNQNMLQNTALGISTSQNIQGIQNLQTGFNGGINAVGGVVAGIGNGNPIGGIVNGLESAGTATVNILANTAVNNAQNALRNNVAQNNSAMTMGINNRNLAFADYAALGDYSMQIKEVQAQTQNMQIIAPSTSGATDGDAFNMANGVYGWSLRFRRINDTFIKSIGDYWFRFGYAFKRYIQPPANLKCMTHFTYWQMQDTYILSTNVPESYKQSIRGIFERGTTVWNDPNDILTRSIYDNEVI